MWIMVCQSSSSPVSLKNKVMIPVIVFARGFVVDDANTANIETSTIDHWKRSGKLMREFGAFLRDDPRVRVLVLPIFDGIAEIRWRD